MTVVRLKESAIGLPDVSMHALVINRRAAARSGTILESWRKLKTAESPSSPRGLMLAGKMSTYSDTPQASLVALIAASLRIWLLSVLWPA